VEPAQTWALVVLLRRDVELATWPLVRPGCPDLAAVDDLARLVLAARRRGWSIRLREPVAELTALIALAGLAEVLGAEPLVVEVGGQPEGGEQGGVEEVVMPDDPVA